MSLLLPPPVPATPVPTSTPAGAQDLATDLRAVAVAVRDVQAAAAALAAPEFAGASAEAAGHAATCYAARLDRAEAALARAVTAADRFQDRAVHLHRRRDDLEAERHRLDDERAALVEVLAGAFPPGADLTDRVARLGVQSAALRERIADWSAAEADAESDLVAALRGVDSLAEAEAHAAGHRPDEEALTTRLRALLGDPVAVARWWRSLGRAAREELVTEHPELVGNAAGIPVADRDAANRAALGRDLDVLRAWRDDGGLTAARTCLLDNAEHVAEALDEYAQRLDPSTGAELAHLLVYVPGGHGGDGAVAVAFGDPDRADHVSVSVPGLTSEAASTSGNLARTFALHETAVDEDRGTVASVYWLDYDAPSGNPLNPFDPLGQLDVAGVALPYAAAEGGERFADFLDGLRASDLGEAAGLTAIGHSYGSTTLGHALVDGAPVDDAVLVGSPGVPAPTAAGLGVAEVWVGAMDNDPVTLLGAGERGGVGSLGHDPAAVGFGGTRFATEDGELRVGSLVDNHSRYFEGDSLDNIARIVTGGDDDVTTQPARGAPGGEYRTLPELLAGAGAASAGDRLGDAGAWLVDVLRTAGRPGGIL